MKMIIQKEDLLYAVGAVERAVSSKNTLPILSGILISAEPGKAVFRATDLELAVECTVSAEVNEAGSVVTPGKKLAQLVRLLPNGPVELTTGREQQLQLKYQQSEVFVPQLPPEDFPLLPKAEGELKGRIPAPALRRLIRQVGIAAANDELRPVFTGIFAEFELNDLVMVATDTHRLTRGSGQWSSQGGQTSMIIPNRVLQEVARLAVNDDEDIMLVAGKNQVFFSFANLTFTSRLIVGQYPDYKQVIPAQQLFVSQVVVEKQALYNSLERAALITQYANQKNNIVKLGLEQSGLRVIAETPEEGRINEELPALVNGEMFEINYNVRYLLDALKVIDSEQIMLKFTGANTPGLILPGQDEGEFLYLLLPVRTGR